MELAAVETREMETKAELERALAARLQDVLFARRKPRSWIQKLTGK
jgi:hypothetical protein